MKRPSREQLFGREPEWSKRAAAPQPPQPGPLVKLGERLLNWLAWKPVPAAMQSVPTEPEASSIVYDQQDRFSVLDIQDITPAIGAIALQQAKIGQFRELGNYFDTMIHVDPFLRRCYAMRLVGISSTPCEIVPADGSNEAADYAAAFAEAMDDPNVDFPAIVEGLVAGELQGVGLIDVQNAAKEPGESYRGFAGFRQTPMQRLRVNYSTGALEVTASVWDFYGTPYNESPAGKWIPVIPEAHVLSVSARGYLRSIMSSFQDRLFGRDWRRNYVERFGNPILLGEVGSALQKRAILDAWAQMGANPAIVLEGYEGGVNAKLNLLRGDVNNTVHRDFNDDAADEIALCLVGQVQTMIVRKGVGSKASAHEQNIVRQDIQLADWALVSHALRRYLAAPWCSNNIPGFRRRLAPKFRTRVLRGDALNTLAAALQILVGMGLKVPLSYLYEQGLPAPKDGEETLTPAATLGGAPKPEDHSNVDPNSIEGRGTPTGFRGVQDQLYKRLAGDAEDLFRPDRDAVMAAFVKAEREAKTEDEARQIVLSEILARSSAEADPQALHRLADTLALASATAFQRGYDRIAAS